MLWEVVQRRRKQELSQKSIKGSLIVLFIFLKFSDIFIVLGLALMYAAQVMQPTDILDDCAVVLLSLWLSTVFLNFFPIHLEFQDGLSCSCKKTCDSCVQYYLEGINWRVR